MKRQEIITVDLKVAEYCPLKLKQFDTTELTFDIYDNSTRINLGGISADLVFTKPDTTIVMQECEIANNQVVVNLLPDCVRLAGESKIEVELKKDNEVVSSFFIPIKIEPSSKENIQSDNTPNYIEILEDAIALEKERKQNEEKRAEAEIQRVKNEENRVEAETERDKVEKKRVTAENSRNDEEAKRTVAEENRVTAESERVEAEKTRIANENARITNFENMASIVQPEKCYKEIIAVETSIITLPFWYKVGANMLKVYYNGQLLTKASSFAGDDGYYLEITEKDTIGEAGQWTNKIQSNAKWTWLKDVICFVEGKGVLENEPSAK